MRTVRSKTTGATIALVLCVTHLAFTLACARDDGASIRPETLPADSSIAQATPQHMVVASVDGEPISVTEFRQTLLKNRAMVAGYFNREFGAQDSREFWTRSFNGEVPLDRLKKTSLDQCVRRKVEQMICREHGLIADITYAAFEERLKAENARRKQAVAVGQVIYGPVQYSPSVYSDYLLSNMILRLKQKLAQNQFHLSENQLRQIYEQNKQRYKRPDTVTIEAMALQYGSRPPALPEPDAYEMARRIKHRLEQGHNLADVARESPNPPDVLTFTFSRDTASQDVPAWPRLRDEALSLQPGQVSEIIRQDDLNLLFVATCINRRDAGYRPLDDVRRHIQTSYVDAAYDELVDQRVANAAIEINRHLYDHIDVRQDLPPASDSTPGLLPHSRPGPRGLAASRQ